MIKNKKLNIKIIFKSLKRFLFNKTLENNF